MADQQENLPGDEPQAHINKLEVPDILDIYKTRLLNETKQEFFDWIKSYALIFMLIAWLVSLIGVGYIVEKITEDKLEQKVVDIENRSDQLIEKNVQRLAAVDASIAHGSQLAGELKAKLAKRRNELTETSNLIRAASQDSAGEFLRYERLVDKIRIQIARLSHTVAEIATNNNYDSINTDLKIFEYEIDGIFDSFAANGKIYIDLATRPDSTIDIPSDLAYWLADRGFVVRRYTKIGDSALRALYGGNYNSLITSSNFIMIKYSNGNEEIMKEIVTKLKSDPYFKRSKYDISKSNSESIASFVSIVF